MPTITNYYGIPGPVPFEDVEVTADNRLYVDPRAIRLCKSGQAIVDQALLCLDTFTEQITNSILEGTPARRCWEISEFAPEGAPTRSCWEI